MIRSSRGFSLVELMVAMVVSLVVILGAGQLFISFSQTSERITRLSEKQAAVNFAVETLLRDIRRAVNTPKWDESTGTLTLVVENRGDLSPSTCHPGLKVTKEYRLREWSGSGEAAWYIAVNAFECDGSPVGGGFQDLVGGFLAPDEDGFHMDDSDAASGVWKVIFRLVPTSGEARSDAFIFYAVNRTDVLASRAIGSNENDNDGSQSDGNVEQNGDSNGESAENDSDASGDDSDSGDGGTGSSCIWRWPLSLLLC